MTEVEEAVASLSLEESIRERELPQVIADLIRVSSLRGDETAQVLFAASRRLLGLPLTSTGLCPPDAKLYPLTAAHAEEARRQLDSIVSTVGRKRVVGALVVVMRRAPAPSADSMSISRVAADLLTRVLMLPGGLHAAIVTFLTEVPRADTQAYEKIIKLVCTYPRPPCPPDSYVSSMGAQVHECLCVRGPEAQLLHHVAAQIAFHLCAKDAPRGRRFIVHVICAPLVTFVHLHPLYNSAASDGGVEAMPLEVGSEAGSESKGEWDEFDTVAGEGPVGCCVRDLEVLLVHNTPTPAFTLAMEPLFPALFHLALAASRSPSALRSPSRAALLSLLKRSSLDQQLRQLQRVCLVPLDRCAHAAAVAFAAGPTGGITLRNLHHPVEDWGAEVQFVVSVLKELASPQLSADLFIHLIRTSNQLRDNPQLAAQHLVVLQTVAEMADVLGASMLQDVTQLLALLPPLIQSHAPATVHLSLALLDLLLHSQPQLTAAQRLQLDSLLPLLRGLCSSPDAQMADLAAALRTSISLLPSVGTPQTTSMHVDHNDQDDAPRTPEYNAAMRELADPLLPVRASALLRLKKLVLARDESVQSASRRTKLIDIFLTNLRHEDSYVYLHAIGGLAAMADAFPVACIPAIACLYAQPHDSLPVHVRQRLAEVLLNVVRRAGDALPKYSDPVVYSLLAGARSPIAEVRASSVSALADAAQQLGVAVFPYIQELVDCAVSLLSSDKDATVQRACILLMGKLLEGLGRRSLDPEPMGVDRVRAIYNALKLAAGSPVAEELTREQASWALGVVDGIMMGIMFGDEGGQHTVRLPGLGPSFPGPEITFMRPG